MNPANAVNKMAEQLRSWGLCDIEQFSVSHSSTANGNSSYITIGDCWNPIFKVRVSDHSVTNSSRILEEFHANTASAQVEAMQIIERYFFPERYETVICIEWSAPVWKSANAPAAIIAAGKQFKALDVSCNEKGQDSILLQISSQIISYIRK